MKIADVYSIYALSKKAIDVFLVENPPVAIVVIEWANESNAFIPKIQYKAKQEKVKIQ